MPASLWLIPPATHPLSPALESLISDALPTHLDRSTPSFHPHVTLISPLDLASLVHAHDNNAQSWLESIAWPWAEVKFVELAAGQTFTKRLFIRCEKGGLAALAQRAALETGSARSSDVAWDPHVSLMYSQGEVGDGELETVGGLLLASGVVLGDEHAGTDGLTGWSGGSIWLVDTGRPVAQWVPLASVELVRSEGQKED